MIDSIQDNTEIPVDPQEEQVPQTSIKVVAAWSKALVDTRATIPMHEEDGLTLNDQNKLSLRTISVNRTSPDTAIHEHNGYAKVYNDKYTFKTNVDNDNSDTTYTNMHNK